MEITMKRGVLAAFLLLALALGGIFAFHADQAYAKTTDNTGFTFSMGADKTAATSGRDKNDSSSVFMKISSITNPCRMYVDGKKSKTKGTWTNCTVNGYAKAKSTGKWRIKNTVHESGYGFARLTGWANKGASVVKGAWSPDSLGSYTAINA